MHAIELTQERRLVKELAEGSKEAFTVIYGHYCPILLAQMRRLLGTDMLAREVTQEVFFKVWQTRSRLDVDKCFRSYLFRIAANKACDHFRKVVHQADFKRRYSEEIKVGYQHVEEDLMRKERRSLLLSAIDALPPRRREIYDKCKLQGKSYSEISQLFGVSLSTISDHIVKANHFIQSYFLIHAEK
jgi:RNA polymerase sigma-70 factor (ECF subfamily)